MKQNHIIGISPVIENVDIDLLKAAGVQWVRMFTGLPYMEKRDEVSQAFLDRLEVIKQWRNKGFKIFGTTPGPGSFRYSPEEGKTVWVSRMPEWMGVLGTDEFWENLEYHCAESARLTKDIVDMFQVANEPDIDIFKGALTDDQSVQYLLSSARGVKKGNPDAQAGINLGFITDYSRWLLRQLYVIPECPFDYLGLDAYFGSWQPGGPESWIGYINETHEITGKPIMINEWGYSSIESSPKTKDLDMKEYYNQDVCRHKAWDRVWKKEHNREEQAEFISECLEIFANHPNVIGNFFFRWSDTETCWQCGEVDCPAECAWGMVDVKQDPKPAYYAYQESIKKFFK